MNLNLRIAMASALALTGIGLAVGVIALAVMGTGTITAAWTGTITAAGCAVMAGDSSLALAVLMVGVIAMSGILQKVADCLIFPVAVATAVVGHIGWALAAVVALTGHGTAYYPFVDWLALWLPLGTIFPIAITSVHSELRHLVIAMSGAVAGAAAMAMVGSIGWPLAFAVVLAIAVAIAFGVAMAVLPYHFVQRRTKAVRKLKD